MTKVINSFFLRDKSDKLHDKSAIIKKNVTKVIISLNFVKIYRKLKIELIYVIEKTLDFLLRGCDFL